MEDLRFGAKQARGRSPKKFSAVAFRHHRDDKPGDSARLSKIAGVVASGLVVATVMLVVVHDGLISGINTIAGCTIKGNINMNSGERIYHVPGQEFYTPTVITFLKGERWFCSEDEARLAGWRPAGR